MTKIYGLRNILQAIAIRHERRFTTSLSREFIDGFDHHTLESIFGKEFESVKEYPSLNDENSYFYELGQTGDEGFDWVYGRAAYDLCILMFWDAKNDRRAAGSYNIIVRDLYDLCDGDEEEKFWLSNMLEFYEIPNYTSKR